LPAHLGLPRRRVAFPGRAGRGSRPTRLAVLDVRFTAPIARWPQITAAIVDRVVQRGRW
jgi:hypothetical protein